jgi:hypothetical protein
MTHCDCYINYNIENNNDVGTCDICDGAAYNEVGQWRGIDKDIVIPYNTRQPCECSSTSLHYTCMICYKKLTRICPPNIFQHGMCVACNISSELEYYMRIVRNPYAICNKEMQVYDECIMALKCNGHLLPHIRNKTPEMYEIAVETSGSALAHVPHEYHSPDLYVKAGYEETHFDDWIYVPYAHTSMLLRHITPDIIPKLLPTYFFLIFDISDEYITHELVWSIIRKNAVSIIFIPDKYITYDMWEYAVDAVHELFKYIPYRYITPDLACRVLHHDYGYLSHIPKYMLTADMCKIAIKQNPSRDMLVHVSKLLRSSEFDLLIRDDEMGSLYNTHMGDS